MSRKQKPFSGLMKETVKFASWNIGSLTGRAGEVVEVLERRGIDLCCLQETRWKGSGTDWIPGKESKYKLFWMGSEEGQEGVGIIIKEAWEDKVIEVKRINSRLILMKMILNERVVAIVSAYAPQVGREAVAKEDFWDTLSATCMDISDKEMIIVGGI
jgi:exonuclease III